MKDWKRNRSINVYLLCFFIWAFSFNTFSFTYAQSDNTNCFPILFYNVENLFDCRDDSLKSDEEFLPDGVKHWSVYRYNNKVNKIAKVILASNEWNPPALVGLCEVENQTVLNRLIWETGLSELGYRFIHYESPDRRGIDVALLYRENQFKIIHEQTISVSIPEKNFLSRDILFVKGLAFGKDTLNIMVCHWPSKYGGAMHSEWKRTHVAKRLHRVCDSLLKINKDCHIIIMGDLNESPESEAVYNILKARENRAEANLVNLSFQFTSDGIEGTSKYKGQWSIIDQIIVSRSLLEEPFEIEGLHIIDLPFLLEPDKTYSGTKPCRTYLGPLYHGGFSDHLPVKIVVKKEQ